jgi:ABC-type proline/glycine betaine transport systems, permease component
MSRQEIQFTLDLYGDQLATAIWTHLYYVCVSVGSAFVIALIAGILLSRSPKWAHYVLPVISISQTIPGIVFVGILFLYLGMVPLTVIIALTIYAIFPILKNTYIGILEVEPQCREAAIGCGMSGFQMLTRVELPLAAPAIFSGLKMATVYTVSWAVLAAIIGMGGLGELIYMGVSTNNNVLILFGAVPAAIMAVALSLCVDCVKRRSMAWRRGRDNA